VRSFPFPFIYIYTYNVLKDTFLQINDQINTVLTRYDAFKKGDFSFASNPIPQELASGSGSSQGISLIDFDDSAPASSETTGGGNDLSGLFSYVAQPGAQVPAQYQPQQQQQPQPSTYAPTPLFYNNNGGGMNTFMHSTSNSMTPHRQLSGTPPASIALPQSKPGSQRSTPAPAPAATPNYFGNAGARGPVGGMGMNRGMGGGLPISLSGINAGVAPSAMNLSGAMSGMSLNGGGGNMGMGGPVMFHPQSSVPKQQQPQQVTTAPAPPPAAPAATSGNDPFADLAGLF
jgi:ADP-ribosylation factor-binding protein GGA